MAAARVSLRSFLAQSKKTLASARANGQKLTFVIGNESADLDSLTSSLLFAYMRSNAPPPKAFSRFYIPVLNIPASDISLRPEFLVLSRHANIEPDLLITLDDLPKGDALKSELDPELTQWILVDHNALQGVLGSVYASRLGGTIDHHVDENKVPADVGDEPRIIEVAGSCSSLVTNYCRKDWDALSTKTLSSAAAHGQDDANPGSNDEVFSGLWDTQVAKLALASILIDTSNLKNEDKVTKHDTDAVTYLEAKIMSSVQGSRNYDRDQFFTEISDAKKNIGNLDLSGILRKDYKQWEEAGLRLGVASVVKNMDFLIDKAVKEQDVEQNKSTAFLNAVTSFAKVRELDLFAIMTTSTSATGKFQRELFLSTITGRSRQAASRFEDDAADECGLTSWNGSVSDIDHTDDNRWCRIWQQHSVEKSRKQVAPLLRRAMQG